MQTKSVKLSYHTFGSLRSSVMTTKALTLSIIKLKAESVYFSTDIGLQVKSNRTFITESIQIMFAGHVNSKSREGTLTSLIEITADATGT